MSEYSSNLTDCYRSSHPVRRSWFEFKALRRPCTGRSLHVEKFEGHLMEELAALEQCSRKAMELGLTRGLTRRRRAKNTS
jgi:hypothetical protein